MLNINDGWQFAKGESGEYASVNIPHDWLIAEIHEKNESAMGCYKRTLNIAFSEGQRVLIHFDGVYMDSTLFVNDKWAGEWKYGYTAFEYDITDYLLSETDNQLLLKVNYKSNSARWYTGAGLYRDVHVKVKNACHFVSDGINITTKKIDGHWAYEVDAEVETDGKAY